MSGKASMKSMPSANTCSKAKMSLDSMACFKSCRRSSKFVHVTIANRCFSYFARMNAFFSVLNTMTREYILELKQDIKVARLIFNIQQRKLTRLQLDVVWDLDPKWPPWSRWSCDCSQLSPAENIHMSIENLWSETNAIQRPSNRASFQFQITAHQKLRCSQMVYNDALHTWNVNAHVSVHATAFQTNQHSQVHRQPLRVWKVPKYKLKSLLFDRLICLAIPNLRTNHSPTWRVAVAALFVAWKSLDFADDSAREFLDALVEWTGVRTGRFSERFQQHCFFSVIQHWNPPAKRPAFLSSPETFVSFPHSFVYWNGIYQNETYSSMSFVSSAWKWYVRFSESGKICLHNGTKWQNIWCNAEDIRNNVKPVLDFALFFFSSFTWIKCSKDVLLNVFFDPFAFRKTLTFAFSQGQPTTPKTYLNLKWGRSTSSQDRRARVSLDTSTSWVSPAPYSPASKSTETQRKTQRNINATSKDDRKVSAGVFFLDEPHAKKMTKLNVHPDDWWTGSHLWWSTCAFARPSSLLQTFSEAFHASRSHAVCCLVVGADCIRKTLTSSVRKHTVVATQRTRPLVSVETMPGDGGASTTTTTTTTTKRWWSLCNRRAARTGKSSSFVSKVLFWVNIFKKLTLQQLAHNLLIAFLIASGTTPQCLWLYAQDFFFSTHRSHSTCIQEWKEMHQKKNFTGSKNTSNTNVHVWKPNGWGQLQALVQSYSTF